MLVVSFAGLCGSVFCVVWVDSWGFLLDFYFAVVYLHSL